MEEEEEENWRRRKKMKNEKVEDDPAESKEVNMSHVEDFQLLTLSCFKWVNWGIALQL